MQAVLIKDKEGETISKIFENYIKFYTAPENVQTDNGKEFCNKDFEEICKKYSITHKRG